MNKQSGVAAAGPGTTTTTEVQNNQMVAVTTTLVSQNPGIPVSVSFQAVPQVQQVIQSATTSTGGKIQTVTLQASGIPMASVKAEVSKVSQVSSNSTDKVHFQHSDNSATLGSKLPIPAGPLSQKLPPVSVAVLPPGQGKHKKIRDNCRRWISE